MTDTFQMTTRMAVESDVSAVMQLEQRTANAAHWTEAQYKQIFQAEPRRIMLLVEEANRLRGFVVASFIGTEWEVENVVVDGSARRRGFGKMLLQSLIDQANIKRASRAR